MTDTPGVTVIVVTNVHAPTLEEALYQELSGPVLRAIRSFEDQDYPDKEISIVRNLEDYPLDTMRRLAALQSEKPWLAFLDENKAWPTPDTLASLMRPTSIPLFQGTYDADGYLLVGREQFLKETA